MVIGYRLDGLSVNKGRSEPFSFSRTAEIGQDLLAWWIPQAQRRALRKGQTRRRRESRQFTKRLNG